MKLLPLIPALFLAVRLFAADNWMVDPVEARALREGSLRDNPAAFAPVTDDPALPRVLLIGDSISIGYTPGVRKLLTGVANVHRIPDNGGATVLGLAMLDEWLGSGHWDVIHFNFGLHDVTQDAAGHVRTEPDVYEKNLREIVRRLQQTGARLVFATSTPVPGITKNPTRNAADGVVVNERALKVMAEMGVPVNDLYTLVVDRLDELQIHANVHFRDEGSRVLAEKVAAAIREALARPAPAAAAAKK